MRVEACAALEGVQEQRGDGPVGNGPLVIAVLGDSYAQGQPLRDPLGSWPTSLAVAADATVWVHAVGGSGFAGSGPCPGAEYPRRAPEALVERPDLVVVQGGLNDVSFSDDEVVSGFRAADAALRGTRTVVVGPPLAPKRDAADVERIDSILSATAHEQDIPYVSVLGWELTYAADRLHLDEAGHETFGRRVAAALSQLGY